MMKKIENKIFYAIDYKTGTIVQITEKDLVKTYSVESPKTTYYPTCENKIIVEKIVETKDRQRYYKLFNESGEVAIEIKAGDIVRDKEDFIYKVLYDEEDEVYYAKMIGDCILFDGLDISFYDRGDDNYDSEDD